MTRWRWSMSTMAGLSTLARRRAAPSGEVPQVPERLPEGLLAQVERALVGAVLDLDAHGPVVAGVRRAPRRTGPSSPRRARAAWAGGTRAAWPGCPRRRAARGRAARPWRGRGRSAPRTRGAASGSPCAARRSARGRSSGRSSGSGCRRTSAARSPGVVARFLPPGHSSPVKSIGQFSMPIRTPVLLGVRHERPPRLEEPRPVGVDRLRPVAADERVHRRDAEEVRRADHRP